MIQRKPAAHYHAEKPRTEADVEVADLVGQATRATALDLVSGKVRHRSMVVQALPALRGEDSTQSFVCRYCGHCIETDVGAPANP